MLEAINGRRVAEWIGEGGIREDDFLSGRFFRHFHDPLRPWASAGLFMLPFCPLRCESSVRWMQRLDQGWSWQSARGAFHAALTAPDPDERELAFAHLFRSLGQAMHLVVDASVPEHVRNDPHPGGPLFGNYEYWTEGQHGRPGSPAEEGFILRFLSTPRDPDQKILGEPTADLVATVPVARLIDTNKYDGTNPEVTRGGRAIGIAEVANANFFSENRGRESYPFPDPAVLTRLLLPSPRTGWLRAYYVKPGTDEDDDLDDGPALVECALAELPELLPELPGDPRCVDERVWEETADAMLPRAAGYARAALDYFFRGRLGPPWVTIRPIRAGRS